MGGKVSHASLPTNIVTGPASITTDPIASLQPTPITAVHDQRVPHAKKGSTSRHGPSKRKSKKKSAPSETFEGRDAFLSNEIEPERAASAQHSDVSHAWLSEAITESRENSEEIVRSLRSQLLDAQTQRDEVRSQLEIFIQRSAGEKSRLDRMLLIAAKETARVEEEKMKILQEFSKFKEKVVEERNIMEQELRRLRAELAMSNRHEEFLSRQLEDQRAAAESRMEVELGRSKTELSDLGRELEDLRERCSRLTQGKSLVLLTRRRPGQTQADSSSDES